MTLVICPECGNKISDKAVMCPQCGHPRRGIYGFEYKSSKTLFGLPLVHIVSGPAIDPMTGKLRIAKGIVAIGGIAVGGLAIGGVAVGGCAIGYWAMGGAAIGAHPMGGNMPDDQLPEWFRRFRRR